MKSALGISAILIIAIAFIGAWLVFGSATKFSNKARYLYVRDGNAQQQIMHQLDTGNTLRSTFIFNMLAKQANAWQRITH